MKGLKVEIVEGEYIGGFGSVTSEAQMGNDDKFYVIVLVGGEFPKIATSSLRLVSSDAVGNMTEAEEAYKK